MTDSEGRGDALHRTLDALWRMESPRIVATVARMTGDLGLAEEVVQDAFEAALRQWPASGIPDRPAAWLMGTAKHRAIDAVRRRATLGRKTEELGRSTTEAETPPDLDAAIDNAAIGDDLLRLVFICCHPVLSSDARVALTLRLLGGLRTDEIARAFLVPDTTIGQRISRAKRTLAEARVPFEIPTGPDFEARLGSVLEVVYLIFNEGYTATSGDAWMRPALCEDALRLARVLAGLAPAEPEVHGLVALLEIQGSRLRARVDPASGAPIPLLEQHRERWDGVLIGRGLASLARADSLAGPRGPYALQAAIAACHARARTPGETDWSRIVALYDALAALTPSPVVELNRAVAVAMAGDPEAALVLVDAVAGDPRMAGYHLVPAVRADLLSRLGRDEEAVAELVRAASLARNAAERTLLLERAQAASRASVHGGRATSPG